MNIAEILKNCPEGMKLYSPIFGEVEFTEIRCCTSEIECRTSAGSACFYSDGTYYKCGECMLFPSKEQRDWKKFLIPFKDGDVIILNKPIYGCTHRNTAVFKEYNDNAYNKMTIYCQVNGGNQFVSITQNVDHKDWRKANAEEINLFTERMHQEGYYFIDKELIESFKYGDIVAMYNEHYDHTHVAIFNKPISKNYSKVICTNNASNIIKVFGEDDCWRSKDIRKATREEADFFFKLLEEQGYKWDGKELTKVIKPKFKVGDTITNGTFTFKIGHIDNEYYYEVGRNVLTRIFITDQDKWKIKKFDILSLKPYDRVLVRFEDGAWYPTLVSYVSSPGQVYTIDSEEAAECVIPFEGNEHLIGKFDDPNSFYITW